MYVWITLSRNMCYTCTLTPTRLLGTPTEETWPNITHLPDYKVSVIFNMFKFNCIRKRKLLYIFNYRR